MPIEFGEKNAQKPTRRVKPMGFEEPVPMKVQTKNMDGAVERKLKPAVRKPTDDNKDDIPEDQKLSYPRVKRKFLSTTCSLLIASCRH